MEAESEHGAAGLRRSRLYLVLGILLVAALGWAAWQTVRPRPQEAPEPVYEGRPLDYWLTNVSVLRTGAMDGLFPDPRWRGVFVLPAGLLYDSNAVPFLVKALKRDSWMGAAVYRKQVWPKLPSSIQKRLPPPHGDPGMRMTAADYLTQMGPRARAAIPSLIRALKEDDVSFVRAYAAVALGSIGKDDSTVTTTLTKALKDKDGQVGNAAAAVLHDLDPEAAAKAGAGRQRPEVRGQTR
jgi:hypothetical protein